MLFNDYMAVGFSALLRLKIESGPPEMGLKDERSNQPRALRCLQRHGIQPYHRDNWLVAAKRS